MSKQNTEKIKADKNSKSVKKEYNNTGSIKGRNKVLTLGAFLGFIAAFMGLLYSKEKIPPSSFAEYVAIQMKDIDFNKFIPESIIREELFGNLTNLIYPKDKSIGDVTPGLRLKAEGAKPNYPVFIIPGIISTGLENWSMDGCSKKYFRDRFWGTMTMFKAILMDKECWLKNMSLDVITGLDPEGVKMRAAQGIYIFKIIGIDAADYFISGYWVWGKIIENLAALGYDNNNMHLAAYDWRLSYTNLEKRDNFFTKLKNNIELSKNVSGKKAVLFTHSMGSLVIHYFMKWVESKNGGKGGPEWVENHIHSIANIAGAFLGAPKTVTTLMSGESRETVQPLAQYLMDHFFNKTERANLFRGWGGLSSLLPKGGNKIWGDLGSAPDDETAPGDELSPEDNGKHVSNGNFLMFSNKGLTVEDSIELLLNSTPKHYSTMVENTYSFGLTSSESDFKHDDPLMWTNPLESQLPNAPSLSIYCLYGYGLDSERHYYYNEVSKDQIKNINDPSYIINVTITNENVKLKSGVRSSNGDGSVPLISLGYMCAKGWRSSLFNPSKSKITTREYKHLPVPIYEDIRGGIGTAEHIDILGNYNVTVDLLRIASGFYSEHELSDQIESEILDIAKNVNLK